MTRASRALHVMQVFLVTSCLLLSSFSPLHSYQSDVFFVNMPMKSQYRWAAWYPDRPNEKGSWLLKKEDVVKDFTEYIDNEEMLNLPLPGTTVDPINPVLHQDPVYYLDKRLLMDDETNNANSFFIYTMKKEGMETIPMES